MAFVPCESEPTLARAPDPMHRSGMLPIAVYPDLARAAEPPSAPTEGGRLLSKALHARRLSWAAASRALGRNATYCRRLILGLRLPRDAGERARLERAFGVPPAAWDRRPRGPIARRPSGPVPGGRAC